MCQVVLDKEIVLVGYSGHGYVVAEAAMSCNMNIKYYSDINKSNNNPYKLKYLGFEKSPSFKGWNKMFSFALGLGDNKLRIDCFNFIKLKGFEIINVKHESASVSNDVCLGTGNFISRNASINSLAVIKDCCIINTGAIIEHECIINKGAHIGPGAVLAGNVEVGVGSFVGGNAFIKQGVKIGRNTIVGAGSVVLKDVPDNVVVYGNPVK
ncbi:acetyltransferase [Polaribacter dokdonensis]|uniref:Sugar O-acyltransferase, sialic acid O-acetyltransferase NeuD family n=1 Tax=Polaribacter dokdonensis DSW-5 TaxID=1300348 RepID=A0A1H5KCG6_9FLAO|nr:acetyltransferase [Polaribacter dokdonensis]SEE62506.1 sugar O-acyltransferase, sialic acid O-acetyltransferase NeuD family [Polaribacter dokdonensis DSW-5]